MKLTSLGTAHLATESGSATPVLGVGKPLALLLYLSAAPKRSASRSALISLLWTDLEPDAAKHALRQTIWYLRKKTGQDVIVAEGDALRLSERVSVDRDDLLSASKAGDHSRVVELYTGPFVSSFAAPGGAGFEEWAALERRRLLEVFRHSAEAVIARQLATGKAKDAVALARRLRDQDENNESGWRLLIEVCVSADDLLSARAEAEALQQLAEQEVIELQPATRATLRAVKSSPAAPAADSENRSPALVGREDTFASLLNGWEQTRSGKARRIHITARPGLGKTRLLRDLATRIRAMRGRVIMLGGSLGTRDVEFAVAGDLAAGLASLPGRQAIAPDSAATLVDLNPSLSTWFDRPPRTPPSEDRMLVRTLAVRELMVAVSFEHPIAILIDDLHWWDDPSATLLAAAMDGVSESRVMLVTAGRPESRRVPLVSTPVTTHLVLDPLTAAQVEELVLGIASLPPEPWSDTFAGDLWRASRGSPLLALGMLQYLEERALLQRLDGAWHSARPDVLSAELQQGDVLRTRLASLDRTAFWLLTLLATAGSTLTQEVLASAADRPGTAVVEELASLESRGFVVRDGEGWRTAHDEIAEEVVRLNPADGAARAAGQLGRALAAPPLDNARARRAAQLLRQGDDITARADLFRAFGTQRYALGDRRSVSAIAADLLGATARPGEVAELRRAAPFTWRLGLVSPMRRAVAVSAALLVVAVSTLAIRTRAAPVAPDAVLALVFSDSAHRVSIETVNIRESGWSPQDTLIPEAWNAPPITLISGNGFSVDYTATTRTYVTSEAVEGKGTIDLFLYRGDQPARPFFPADGDDVSPVLSPDGRRVAFGTARWNSLSRYDIAIAAVDGDSLQQVTSGPATDGGPRWSPDGSRLAFNRFNWGAAPNELCVAEGQTFAIRCQPMLDPQGHESPLGWLDQDRLVVQVTTASGTQLRVLHWETGESVSLSDADLAPLVLSPDGSWLLCQCALSADGARTLAIVPLSAPSLVRPVRVPGVEDRAFLGAFWVSSRASLKPTTVRIIPQPMVQAQVPAQLRATFRDGRGNVLQMPRGPRWRVSDPLDGSIDSLRGVLVASGRTPSVTVVASDGAGVVDSAVIPVSREPARLVLDEAWDRALTHWWPFGYPAPTVTTGPGGAREFLNNGDGSYYSAAITRSTFDPSRGIAVEAEVRTPQTIRQWQTLIVTLQDVRDTSDYKSAAGANVIPFQSTSDIWCAFGYPREGMLSPFAYVANIASRHAERSTKLDALEYGRPWRLRLQLFPDGRCGVAVNGTSIGVVDGGTPPTPPLRLIVGGNSYDTRIAVGPLRVYEGVLPGVDWKAAR